jgi:hypothetical protein
MKKLLTLLSASGVATLITASSALAQAFPTTLVGTWSVRANNTDLTLTVQSQSSDSPCAQITGTLYGSAGPIVGYYCPATGLVSFELNAGSAGATYQVYFGQASWAGTETEITGNFTSYDGGNGNGAFSFSAQNPG